MFTIDRANQRKLKHWIYLHCAVTSPWFKTRSCADAEGTRDAPRIRTWKGMQ